MWFFPSFTKLMSRLRYPHKFALIGTLLIVPICISGYMLVSDANDKLHFAHKERQGLDYHRTLMQLNDLLSRRRALLMSDDQIAMKPILSETEKELEETAGKLNNLQSDADYLHPRNAWSSIYADFEKVMKMNAGMNKTELYIAHTKIMTDNGYFMYTVANTSGLRNDTHNDTNQLNEAIINQIPLVLSQYDSLIGITIHGVVTGTINGEQQSRMGILSGLNNKILGEIESGVDETAPLFDNKRNQASAAQQTAKQWVNETTDFSLLMNGIFIEKTTLPTLQAVIKGNNVIMTGYLLYNKISELIDYAIERRETALERERILTIGLLVVMVGIAVTLFLAVTLSIMRTVRLLQQTSLQIAAGNLDARVKLDTKDELKSVEFAFNETIRVFGELLEQKNELERRITRQAHYDALTDLPNRFLFHEKLRTALEQAADVTPLRDASVALLYIDLDGFKPVNDRYGHHVGDALLLELASRLRSLEPEKDTAARIGGDEFTIIVPHLDATEDADRLADHVLTELNRAFLVDGIEIRISGSVGIALYPRDGERIDQLIQKADHAMYTAKGNSRERMSRV